MEILGYVLLFIATVCLIPIAINSARELMRGSAGASSYRVQGKTYGAPEDEKFAQTLPTDELPSGISEKESLTVIRAKQTVKLIDDLKPRAVQAAVSLYEMTQLTPEIKNSPWSRTGVVSRAIVLAGNIWIMKVPGREGGKPEWFKAREIETYPLQKFYTGGNESSSFGPARKFKTNGQTSPVPYSLPNDLTPGVTWQVVDIGRFNAEIDGKSDNLENNDNIYFVTSRERGGDRYLIYLDARKGEARGPGGLFMGTPFEPDEDVMEML